MEHSTTLTESGVTRLAARGRAVAGIRFDWIVVTLSIWMIGGIHLDAWAHHRFDLETFFTPWHAVLYYGFLALATVLVGAFIRNLTKGYAGRQAIPSGYELSLMGVALFAVGAVGDMVWHTLFGIEVNIEALLSPTHLLLAFGGGLIVTGPLRAAWQRTESGSQGWASLLPAIISLTLLLAVLSFFTGYANPLSEAQLAQGSRPAADEEVFLVQGLGTAGILIQTGVMMGVLLLAARRWTLPFGSLTLILAASTLLTVSIHEDFYLLPFAVVTGLMADVLYRRLKPSVVRPAALRLFAFAVPVAFYALYFATLALTSGVWWTIHRWVGAIVMAGVAGWLISYAFVPPTASAKQDAVDM